MLAVYFFKVIVLGLVLAASVPSMAMIGLRPIGVTAASRALGGTGVANWVSGYDALYKNPALMGLSPLNPGGFDASFGLMAASFQSQARTNFSETDQSTGDWQKAEGGGKPVIFPSGVGGSYRAHESFAFGTGFYGGGGGGDYGERADILGARSATIAYSLLQGAAWRLNSRWAVGATLNISQVETEASSLHWENGRRETTGGTALVTGYHIGLAGQPAQGVLLGLFFQPPLTAKLRNARDYYETEGRLPGERRDDVMFTALPLEVAFGLTVAASPQMKLLTEVRFLQWSEAEFLSSIGFEDQVAGSLAMEYEFSQKFMARIGYLYANAANVSQKNPQRENGSELINFQGHPMPRIALSAIASLSGLGVTRQHFTVGTSHIFSEQLTLDTGLVYMAPGTISRNGQRMVKLTGQTTPYGWTSKFRAITFNTELIWKFH